MNILFYAIPGQRTRDIESQALAFRSRGHRVMLLSQSPYSPLHEFLERHGFETATSVINSASLPVFVFRQAIALWQFCKKHKIDVVYSHLDSCSMVAVLVQYITRARIIVCRHHADALEYEANSRGRWSSRMIYRLAQTVTVVSANARQYMIDVEKINPRKIHVIPLCYDYDAVYELPDSSTSESVRKKFPANLLLVTVGRLVVLKRIDLMIDVIKKIVDNGRDVKLLVLGRGSEEASLKQKVATSGLEDRVIFVGFIPDVLPYLAAADIYLHLSVSEASCTTVKEAALTATPSLVCRSVGDFAEYIVHGENGWLVPKDNAAHDAAVLLQNMDVATAKQVGRKIRDTVLTRFDIRNVIDIYEKFHHRK